MKAIKILIYYLFKRNEGKSKAARQQGSKAARQQGSKAKIMALLYTMQVMYDILLN
jgi:hypothetical protein